jgi:glycosyltransferase involved in cell wall biosynthesis
VINILRVRGALRGWNVVPFINRPQSEVASIMKESLIFLSFGYPEGFGLPAAEAMACGCLVIGDHGGTGREFFKPEFSFPIQVGDIVGFGRTVEEVLTTYDDQRGHYERMRKSAAQFMSRTY